MSDREWSVDGEGGDDVLTRAEVRIAMMICAGMSRRECAAELGVSPKTFDTHRGRVMRKMHVANEVQLVRLAIVKGWVTL